jgi:glycerol-3-phosphate dehydrogenase
MRTVEAQPIDRNVLHARLRDVAPWDAVIIGGGATGLGIAVDAAARGLRVALIEQRDFASGTSSRSTKLIHGGVRYLAQGNVKLVREALAERAVLLKIAPDIVHPLEFVVPCYRFGEREFMRIGLGLYDLLAGKASLGPTRWLSREQTLRRLPGVQPKGLRGGVSYWDAQFDDAAMAIALMQTAFALGATPINYVACESLESRDGRIVAVHARDAETGESFRLATGCVFNAAGVWVDEVRKLADPKLAPVTTVSQGSHIVLDREFLPGHAALLIPSTRDGRVLFLIPWYGVLLVGTTDGARPDAPLEPQPTDAEIGFLLRTAGEYLVRQPRAADIRARFSGLRPLFSAGGVSGTAQISREHAVLTECGNLVSVVGGKWTTYRRMAEDAIAQAQRHGVLGVGQRARTDKVRLVAQRFVSAGATDFRRHLNDPAFVGWARQQAQARSDGDMRARRARLEFIES